VGASIATQKATPCTKTHYTTYGLLMIGPHVLHSSPFYPTRKILCFAVLFNQADTPKCAISRRGIYIPCNTCSLHPPNSASQAVSWSVQPFCTAHGR